MITCIAIDDEPLALNVVKAFIERIPELTLADCFTDAIAAKNYAENNGIDIVFLDIEMPDIHGIKLLQYFSNSPAIIFTTAYEAYAVQGFNVDATDYLLKPFTFARFKKATDKAINKIIVEKAQKEEQHLLVYADYKQIQVPLSNIIYIESLDDYCKIFTTDKNHLSLISLKAIMEKLPAADFTRIHRSYIVAQKEIEFVQFKKLKLKNGIVLPIGDTYRKTMQKIFN
jgi:two-component system, LytTR family, response regulator